MPEYGGIIRFVNCASRWTGLVSWHGEKRMAAFRWWTEKVGKPAIIASDDTFYGIADRKHVTNRTKAADLGDSSLDQVTDLWTRYALRLQADHATMLHISERAGWPMAR